MGVSLDVGVDARSPATESPDSSVSSAGAWDGSALFVKAASGLSLSTAGSSGDFTELRSGTAEFVVTPLFVDVVVSGGALGGASGAASGGVGVRDIFV